jgi:tetratricopeptide (TPR) repeat protein
MHADLLIWPVIALLLVVCFLIWRHKGNGVLANALRISSTIKTIMSAYRAGNYSAALARTQNLKDGSVNTGEYCFYHGSMLHHLGRFVEAETILREGLRLQKDSRQKALVYNSLATVLMDQQRFPEAIAFYESAGRAWPERGANLRGMAEVWLRQGRELQLALDQARQAVEIDRNATGMTKQALDSRLGEDLGVLAWAIAANSGDAAQIESALSEALRLCSGSSRAVLSELHFHASQAYLAIQNNDKSQAHLRQAAEIDPQGIHGRGTYSTVSRS